MIRLSPQRRPDRQWPDPTDRQIEYKLLHVLRLTSQPGPGNQSFRWVGPATLTGAAQLGYFVTGGNTIVRASTDADAAAEVEIQLTGVKVLSEGDFRP